MTNTNNTTIQAIAPAVENLIKTQVINHFFYEHPAEISEAEIFDKIRHEHDISELLSTLTCNDGYEHTDADSLSELIVDEYYHLKNFVTESIRLNAEHNSLATPTDTTNKPVRGVN